MYTVILLVENRIQFYHDIKRKLSEQMQINGRVLLGMETYKSLEGQFSHEIYM